MPILVISIDGAVVKEVPLTKERSTLGRRPYNDIVIDNLAVSGEHAVISMADGAVVIEDLHSTNGTYVNGKSVQRHSLVHGDLLDIGRYKIRFVNTREEPSRASAALDAIAAASTMMESADGPPSRLSTPSGFGEITGFASTLQGTASMVSERHAVVRMLSGSMIGKEVSLYKVVTTLGRPGVTIASITQKPHGFVLTHMEGESASLKLNGQEVGPLPVPLLNGDTMELAGTRMQFVVG